MLRSASYLAGLLVLALTAPPPALASCAAPQSCLCEQMRVDHVLRGRIVSLDDELATVEVQEILAQRAQVTETPGATVAGIVSDPNPCRLPETSFAPGDEVLALATPSGLTLIAWQDVLDLGEGRQLPANEVALLTDRDRCVWRYPAPPPQPCDDVVFSPIDDGCNAAGQHGAASATWCALLLLWAVRRRVPR